MDKKTALKVLIAHTICSNLKLRCCDCPLEGECQMMNDDNLIAAVETLKDEVKE